MIIPSFLLEENDNSPIAIAIDYHYIALYEILYGISALSWQTVMAGLEETAILCTVIDLRKQWKFP